LPMPMTQTFSLYFVGKSSFPHEIMSREETRAKIRHRSQMVAKLRYISVIL
jgi:hypothetical protein